MGFLNKLFGGNPQKDLDKAESLLAQGRPDRARELAARAGNSDDPELRAKSEEIFERARGMLVTRALEMAQAAEESEFWQDAMEWLDRALDQVTDPAERARLEAKKASLDARWEAAEAAEEEAAAPAPAPHADEMPEMETDHRFIALVDMLDDGVGRRYLAQGEDFRLAYLDLYDDKIDDALEVLDRLVAEQPQDPVLRFERGRGRLFQGDAAGAREDFEVASEEWSDIYLDRAGTLSVDGEWSEAMLRLNDPEPVLERLRVPAQPGTGQPELTLLYARALVMADRQDEAEPFLLKAMETFPSRPDFALILAQLLIAGERRHDAIGCLEVAIAPSCAGGSCGKPPRHVPSFRMLAALYLAEAQDTADAKKEEAHLNRVESLLTLIREVFGGGMGKEDLLLQAELLRLRNDEEGAEAALAAAEAMATSDGREVVAMETPKMAADTPI